MEHLLNRSSFQYSFLLFFNSTIHFKVLNLSYTICINMFCLIQNCGIVNSSLIWITLYEWMWWQYRKKKACTKVPGSYMENTRGWCTDLCSAPHGTDWWQGYWCSSGLSPRDFATGLHKKKAEVKHQARLWQKMNTVAS